MPSTRSKKSKVVEHCPLAAAPAPGSSGPRGKDDGSKKDGEVFHFVTVNPVSENQRLENRTVIRSHASKYIWRQHRAGRGADPGPVGPSCSTVGPVTAPGLEVRQYSATDTGRTGGATRRRGQRFRAWPAGGRGQPPVKAHTDGSNTLKVEDKDTCGDIYTRPRGKDERHLERNGTVKGVMHDDDHEDVEDVVNASKDDTSDSDGPPPSKPCQEITPHMWTPDPVRASAARNNNVARPFNQLIHWLESPGESRPSMLDETAISKLMRYAAFDLWPGLVLGAAGQRWDREAAASAWLPRAMRNPALFTAFMYGAAGHMQTRRRLDSVQVVPQTREEKLEQILCETETIKQLNKMMKDPAQAFSDEVVLAVLCMAFNRIDYSGWTVSDPSPKAPLRNLQWLDVYGGLSLNDHHVKGLMAIIETRGGLKALKMPGLAETLSTSGIMLSTKYLAKPRLPFVPIFKATALGQTPNWPSLNATPFNGSNSNIDTSISTSLSDSSSSSSSLPSTSSSGCSATSSTLHFLLSTRPMHNSIPTHPLSPIPPELQMILQSMREYNIVVDLYTQGLLPSLELAVIADRRNYIQYNLLSLAPSHELSDDYTNTYRLYEACRLGAMVYSMLVIFPLPAANRPFKRLVALLITALLALDGDEGYHWVAETGKWPWESGRGETYDTLDPEEEDRISSMYLWIIVMGGIASREMADSGWFVARFEQMVRAKGLSTWEEVKQCLTSIMWMDSVCDYGGLAVWREARSDLY